MKRPMHDFAPLAIAIALTLFISAAQAQEKGTSATAAQATPAPQTQAAPAGIIVLNVGDSITQGVGAAGNYSRPLGELLGTSYSVVAAGISGAAYTRTNRRDYRTSRAYQRAIAVPANVVTIMLGTNDAKINATDPNQDVWPGAKETYKRDVLDLIRRFKYLPTAPRVFVCIPVPASNDNRYSSKGDTIREQIIPVLLEAATEEGAGIIDLWHTELLGQTGDGTTTATQGQQGTAPSKFYQDGVHPNLEGNAVVAAKLAAILRLPAPIVVADGRRLSASVAVDSYQWFRNGRPVAKEAGGQDRAFEAREPGMYAVAVMPSKENADRLVSKELWVR